MKMQIMSDVSIFTLIVSVFLIMLLLIVIAQYIALRENKAKLDKLTDLNIKFHEKSLSFMYNKLLDIQNSVNFQLNNNANLFEKIQKSQFELKENINLNLSTNFNNFHKNLNESLSFLEQNTNKNLQNNFKQINDTFEKILQSISTINEAQKSIQSVSNQINSLEKILSDKKSRGIFGEILLKNILQGVFGEKQELYKLQYTMQNNTRVDALINIPKPYSNIPIDSKFPLENYKKMLQDKTYETNFKQDMKKHINDICEKYIIEDIELAVLFLPAEAIFAQINAYHEDLIDYARNKKVFIASPTTLMALLSTIMSFYKDTQTKKQSKKIQAELVKLSANFSLYNQRWEKFANHLNSIFNDIKGINTSAKKISNDFERIKNVNFDE